MDDQQQHVIDSLKQANNILITVRNSPSIDQLAACIALTLIVNELDKHGTAVFSGQMPPVLEFLEPEKTIERTTDSLRDFIISLDKAKADKLRYKVEDTVVKVFITPYRTSLSPDDLEFGQGDFNVDVVVALGVHNQNDLDEAITAHGRILHDATVISINTEGGPSEDLGSINWIDTNASSLSEMIFGFADKLGKEDVVDNQIATALLTGIVAETGRFSNAKTKPETMEVAAKLLTVGANQELVAAKLAEPSTPDEPPQEQSGPSSDSGGDAPAPEAAASSGTDTGSNGDGELDIEHPEGPSEPKGDNQPSFQLPDTSEAIDATRDEPARSAFAREDDAFEIPQSDFTSSFAESHRPDARKDEANLPESTGEAEGQTPPVLEPEQAVPAPDEEREALDYLKEHKVDMGGRAKIEPLHGQDEILEAPRIITEPAKAEVQAPGVGNAEDDKLNARFALTPPSLGGTLTANVPDERDVSTVESMLEKQRASGPILSHNSLLGGSEGHDDSEEARTQKDKSNDAFQEPSVNRPALDATPLPAPAPEAHASDEPAKPVTTLEDLEKQVHAHEPSSPPVSAEASVGHPLLQAVPQAPPPAPEGAKDMPAPPAIKLPSPQEVSLTGSHMTSPLAPPPPVPPPLPHG